MSLFQSNDPWSFGNVFISMFTMLRIATLEVSSSVSVCMLYSVCTIRTLISYTACICYTAYTMYIRINTIFYIYYIAYLYTIHYSNMYIPYTIYYTQSWGDTFYLNYYGCDSYSVPYYTNNITEASDTLGGLTYCNKPQEQQIASVLFFFSFITLSAFCILALFIAAISMVRLYC